MSRQSLRRTAREIQIVRQWASISLAASSVGLLVAGLVATTAVPAQAADAKVGLGTAASFAVLAGSTVTNTGPSVISGDIGLSPGSSVTGFPPGVVINGTQHVADSVAITAKSDLVAAYNDAAGRPPAADVTGQDLGGMTLTPGVYEASTSMALTGTLTLNAQGNSAAVFIFKAGSTLVTAVDSRVQFINGGSPCNVFWQVGSSATLGTSTDFVGTILALTSASLGTTAKVEGRVLARNGAVTLDNNVITAPDCSATGSTPPPTGGTDGPDEGPSDGPDEGPSDGTATDSVTPTPGPTPTTPIIPKKHPRTGMGGSQASPDVALFILAGLAGGMALGAGALGFGRAAKRRA